MYALLGTNISPFPKVRTFESRWCVSFFPFGGILCDRSQEGIISWWFISHLVAASRSHQVEELPHHFGPLHQAQLRILLATGGFGFVVICGGLDGQCCQQGANKDTDTPLSCNRRILFFSMDFSGAKKMMEKLLGPSTFFNTGWPEPDRERRGDHFLFFTQLYCRMQAFNPLILRINKVGPA